MLLYRRLVPDSFPPQRKTSVRFGGCEGCLFQLPIRPCLLLICFPASDWSFDSVAVELVPDWLEPFVLV